MPADLRESIEEAAREAKRSLNAEIVARLEMSILKESAGAELMPANKAREISAISRLSIPSTMKARILEALARAVSMGHTTASVAFADLGLDGIPERDASELYDAFSEMLYTAGYRYEWDAPDSLWIMFDADADEERHREQEAPTTRAG